MPAEAVSVNVNGDQKFEFFPFHAPSTSGGDNRSCFVMRHFYRLEATIEFCSLLAAWATHGANHILKPSNTRNMKILLPIRIPALTICVLAFAAYGAFTTVRIHDLEQRLKATDERLQKVEATLRPHIELLGPNDSRK